ncbi:receptor tyrosine phosphatase type r2a,putative [Schistosoma mansoni]|uniref:receptor tyrosine phosphatase type r2a,putative n=1 Tax=Schistosoma mansoni TaxID=6183 RepID=UPI0001A631BC|nr:receptor tyrosine phosphatase type r2a,putative [Schistosoma mansoni]|eukprot:XP_018646753.1 receptor tyrosine phosphatase type r2a,putative [Schistosoma mansoni]
MTILNEMLDYGEKIINVIKVYDLLIVPTCHGSLFQELVNLSHVIERKDLNNPHNHIRSLPESKRLLIELNRSEKLFINEEYMRKHHFLLDSFTPLQNTTYYHDISSIDDGLKKQYKHDDRNYHQSKILGRLRRSYFTNYDHSDQTIYYIQKKPQIIEEPKSVITIVGQSVIFVCLAEGNPAPKVQWKVSGTSVSESRFGKTFRAPRGSILRVNNVLPSYNGAVITCTATNALGQAVNSATLTVYSDESNAPSGYPRFLNSFSVIVARKNSEVELECRATGDPIPEITWFRDSIPIDLANPRYKKLDVGNLRIQNLVEEDEGKYECEAKNDKGTRLSSGDNLLVRAKRFRPHFTNVPSSRQIIPPGGQLTLSCTAVGAPVPNVQWYRDKQILPGEQLNKQPPGTAKLVLTNLLKSVNVTCVAESIIGHLPDPPGDFQLIELGATHARIALKPSTSLPSSVRNYLILWLPSTQFTNQTLHELPHQFNLLISQPGDQIEPIMLSNTEHSRPNLIMLPKHLKNISLSSMSNYHLHQQRQQQFQQSDINQQNNNNLISEEIANPHSLYNILMISLTQLKPYTEYTIWARTVGEDGDTSLPNQPFLFTTKELAPSSPPLNVYAQALSNAAVTVYWDPPIESNGRIRAYRIYYTNNPTLEFSYWDTSIVNLEALKSQTITSSVTTYKKNEEQTNLPGHLSILSHLTTNATYYLRVSAVNGQGEGPASDISVVIVRPGVLSKPQNFTATTQSPHEILLQWNPPNDVDPNTRPLEYYELDYQSILDIKKPPDHLSWFNRQTINSVDNSKTMESQRKQQQTSSIHIRPDVTSYLLNNLEPDTRYLFNLIAVSKTGHGVKASTVARTNQFIPSAPKNLTVQAISATQLQVKWKRPIISDQMSDTLSSTRIAYYDLTWRQTDSEGSWSRNDISSGNQQPPAWFNQSSSPSSSINSGIFETNTFGSLQIPTHNKWSNDENHTNLTESWYSANITALQPSTYYVIHLRAVSQSAPSAPQKLRLISQIIPQSSINSPPQILLRITWEPVWYDGYKVGEMSTLYRIRWRLIGGERNFKGAEQSLVKRTLRSTDKYPSESTLYWPIIEKQQKHQQIEPQQHQYHANQFIENGARNPFQSESLVPTKFLHGEVNLTETSWNPASGIFLLGMSYEFRVAVITTLQIGYETIETVSFEGTAPTNTPTSIQVSYTLDQIILSWNPPDWDHRHGIFESYEIKCYRSKPSINVSRVDFDEKMNNQLKSYEDQYFNVTLLNSRVQWPISAPNDLLNIIPWPSGQIRLNYPNDFNYKHGEIDSRLNNNDNTNDYDEKTNYLVRISSVSINEHESKWSEPISTERIESMNSNLAIKVYNSKCRLFYRSQTDLWQLQVKWEVPKQLQTGSYFDQLSHYRGNKLQTDMDTYVKRPYGILENNLCYIPKKTYKLPIHNNNIQTIEQLKLGQWNSSELLSLLIHHSISDSLIQIELSQSLNDTSLRYEKRSEKLLIGKALSINQDYALCMKVCLQPNKHFYSFNIMDNSVKHEPVCYESKWIQPVSTNRPSPLIDSLNDTINSQLNDYYDPDELLWSSNSFGSHSPPPSDDATAQGPGRVTNIELSNIHKNHQLNNDILIINKNQQLSQNIPKSLDKQLSITSNMNPNYLSDSPNTTLYINDHYKRSKLNRVGSISLSYHHTYQLNSPTLSSSNVIYGSNCMKSDQMDLNINNTNSTTTTNNNGIGLLGSLKSVSTMGSKNVQPLNGIDDDNLLSPISNGRCRNLLNSILNRPQICGPIQVANLIEHVQSLKADNGRLMAAEFESIDPGGPFTWEHSNRPANRSKNRYANVIAYDHSRVVLQLTGNNDPDSDYINANYLDGYCKQNAYIATQGPLPHTITDFWRMVWEQHSGMIVSMTRLEEKARVKCEQYWPSNTNGTINFGDISVSLLDTMELAYYTVRSFVLQKAGTIETREVRQLQFTAWPDHGVPNHPAPLLMFLRRVRAECPADSGPVIVHCSAGVGRTGAFILLDILLEQMRHEKAVDVFNTVSRLRAQRNFMVQTEDQYAFIYEALVEAASSGNTEIPVHQLTTHWFRLTDLNRLKCQDLMNSDPLSIGLMKTSMNHTSSSNISTGIIPHDANRVALRAVRGVEGSDYINASYIDGYRSRAAYIATQTPMMNTLEDFWRMIWESGSCLIVKLDGTITLNDLKFMDSPTYWPNLQSARHGFLVVDPIATYTMPAYIMRELRLTDTRDGSTRTVRQFDASSTADALIHLERQIYYSTSNKSNFKDQVHKTKEHFGIDGPITVHCNLGSGITGVFLAISLVLERMRFEGVIDMFQTVKLLRWQRPGLVQTVSQYAFCYVTALEYLESFERYTT